MVRATAFFLALGWLSGCGVGADELAGEGAVGVQRGALSQGPELAPGGGPSPVVPSGPRDPGAVTLPQDPIPVYEGRPGPGATLGAQPLPLRR